MQARKLLGHGFVLLFRVQVIQENRTERWEICSSDIQNSMI